MNAYHRFHRRFLTKRQGLPGVGGLLPGGSAPDSASQGASSAGSQSTDPVGIIGGVTSLVGGVTTDVPSSAPSSTSSTSLTPSSSSSTGSTTTSHSTTSASSAIPTSSTSPPSTTHTTAPTTSTSNIVYTSSDGTSIVYITSTPPAASATSASHTSFLQDPSLEGGVFALVGIVVLIIIFILVTCAIRKRRRDRLERDFAAAVSFDPGATNLYERQEDQIEKHRLSASSSGHRHGFGCGYGSPQTAYAPQPEYHGSQGYGQYSSVAYCPPSNLASYQAPSPAVPQPATQGGANLTRKFSDRKPVPPLLPDPTHDPADTRVPIPLQIYHP